jgi:hypothetical protein
LPVNADNAGKVKMKTHFRILLFCLLIFCTQCGKKADVIDPAFAGVWSGSNSSGDYHLSIDDHSNAYWQGYEDGHYRSAQGVARIENNVMHIGYKHLDIEQYPALDSASGVWTMELSGVFYTR